MSSRTGQGAGFRSRPLIVVLVVAGLVVLLALGGGYVWLLRPLPVTVVPARTGLAMDAVYATGVVDYARQANIAAVVSAPIVSVDVVEGQTVERGQTLARLEDGPQAASAAQLEAQAALSRAVERRATRLADEGYGPKADAEDAQAQRRAAEAAARSAAASLRFYRVTAPFRGVITRSEADVGNLATPSTVLFTLAAADTLRVTAQVDERDIEGLTPGRLALISADGLPGQVIRGQVTAVTPAGDPEARVFRVRVALPRSVLLRPGMTVDVNIILATRASAVLIPAAAVKEDRAWVAAGGKAEPRTLKIGARADGSVEVVSGVRPGERVIVDPPDGLRAGRAVKARAGS